MRLNELFIRFKRTPSACLGRLAHSRPPSGRRHLGAYPFVVVTAVLTQRAVRAARNADGGEVVKGRPVDGGKFRFNVASYLARGSVFPKFLRLGKEHIRSYAMRDPLEWAAHYRKRAAECIELADNSIDAGIEAHYRSLAGRYIKLAEAEEDFAATRPGPHACRLDWMPPAKAARKRNRAQLARGELRPNLIRPSTGG